MYKIVNLETFWVPEKEKYFLLQKEIGDCKHILGLMLADGFIHENPGKIIEKIGEEVDLTIISGLSGWNTNYKKVIDFNFNLHTTYNCYKDIKTQDWNHRSNKFLFLGGVPDRPNRIGLFNKFRKADLLKDSIYSFFKPWTEKQEEWCKSYTADYLDIISLCSSIDTVYESSKHYGTDPAPNTWTFNTGYINPKIFSKTVLSIISEGISDSDLTSKYLTEKTYRVFAHRHPFLHASNPEMFDYIKELGFKTFEEYMYIKDYAYLSNEEDRLDAIVINTKFFLENFKKNIKNIRKDVEHNFNHFHFLALDNTKILSRIEAEYKISKEEVNKWFDCKGFGHLVRAYGN